MERHGFNPTDGLIYGMARFGGNRRSEVFRVGRNGRYQLLGVPRSAAGNAWPETGGFPAAAMLPDGRMITVPAAGTRIYVLDVTTRPPTVVRSFPLAGRRYGDLAVNPIDNLVYGYDEERDVITRIDPDTGAITAVSPTVPADALEASGSVWIDGQGRLTLLGRPVDALRQDSFY